MTVGGHRASCWGGEILFLIGLDTLVSADPVWSGGKYKLVKYRPRHRACEGLSSALREGSGHIRGQWGAPVALGGCGGLRGLWLDPEGLSHTPQDIQGTALSPPHHGVHFLSQGRAYSW